MSVLVGRWRPVLNVDSELNMASLMTDHGSHLLVKPEVNRVHPMLTMAGPRPNGRVCGSHKVRIRNLGALN